MLEILETSIPRIVRRRQDPSRLGDTYEWVHKHTFAIEIFKLVGCDWGLMGLGRTWGPSKKIRNLQSTKSPFTRYSSSYRGKRHFVLEGSSDQLSSENIREPPLGPIYAHATNPQHSLVPIPLIPRSSQAGKERVKWMLYYDGRGLQSAAYI